MARYVYAAWDDTQEATIPSPTAILDALTDDLLQHGDLDGALSAYLRRGVPAAAGGGTLPGISEFLQYLEQQKREMLQHYAADSFQLSESQVQTSQQQVQTRLTTALPPSPPLADDAPLTDELPETREIALQAAAEGVMQHLSGRRRQGPPRPAEGPWGATEVYQAIQQALEDRGGPLDTPEARAQHTRDTLTALSTYLERVQQLEKQLQAFPFAGAQPLGLAEAERLIQAFHYLEELKQHLRRGAGAVRELDLAVLEERLGSTARQQFQQLQQCETRLEHAGLLRRTPEGLRLTVRGIRQIGARVLAEVFHIVQPGGRGQHTAERRGRPGALTGETRLYAFGDVFDVHLGRTLSNALLRQPQVPLRLQLADFEIQQREQLTHSATVIMLDMSHSMELFGRHRFMAAKKMALALAQLIAARFAHDTLHVVGFGDTAREILVRDLPYVTVQQEHTNTQDGLRLARTLLARQRAAHKHIVLITDGRPTAVRLQGQTHFHTWNLHPVILEETLKEAKRCRAQDITLNTFMIADEAPLVQFVKRLTAISQGRAFYTTPERLGSYVIEDYVRRK